MTKSKSKSKRVISEVETDFDLKGFKKGVAGEQPEEKSSKETEVVSNDDKQEEKVSTPTKETKPDLNSDVKPLQPIFDLINQRDYHNENIVGIDKESHEFLSLMKRKLGVKQYAFVSYLIQEFYEQHEEELNQLLSEKKDRKFLKF